MSEQQQSVDQVEGSGDGLCEACRAGNVQIPMGTVVSPEDAAEFDRAKVAAELHRQANHDTDYELLAQGLLVAGREAVDSQSAMADYLLLNAANAGAALLAMKATGVKIGPNRDRVIMADVINLMTRTGRMDRIPEAWLSNVVSYSYDGAPELCFVGKYGDILPCRLTSGLRGRV